MKILVIGGTGLVGPEVVSRLVSRGNKVAVFNRRGISPGGLCLAIQGDRRNFTALRKAFEDFRPDVGIDMIPFKKEDALGFIAAARDICSSIVSVSSIDVYLAYGRLHRTEPGAIFDGPITENSPLRTKLGKEGEDCDKLGVEEILINSSPISATILRLPMIYGPPDLRRIGPYVRRIIDQRKVIVVARSFASWRVSRASNVNCAEAIALSTLNEPSTTRIYNVAEECALSEKKWIEKIARGLNWSGRILEVEDRLYPAPHDIDTRQHIVISSEQIRADLDFKELESPDIGFERALRWTREALKLDQLKEHLDYGVEDQIIRTQTR